MANPTVDEETPLLFESSGKALKRTPLPTLQLAIVLLIRLCEPFASNSIFPAKLITELGITGGDKRKVGYYAGLIVGPNMLTYSNRSDTYGTWQESLFYVAEAMTILQWGRISDHIGRKPVLFIGLAGSALSMLCFGLSRTFWTLVISRCICGLLNGNVGVLKTVMGELTDSTNRADGFAYISVGWSVGATIAPLIGGSLSHPHERFPIVFTSAFWREFPYFLPCFTVAAFTFVCILLMLLLFNETSPRHHKQRISVPFSGTPTSDDKPLPLHKLLTYPVVLSVCNYFCISLMDIAFMSLVPLFMSTPVDLGGLDWSPATIGYVLGAFGAYSGIVQITFFPKLVRRFGERRIFITSVLTITINSLSLPMISGNIRKNGVTWMIRCLLAFTLSLRAVTVMSYGCIFVYINTSSPNKSSLGATNGVAQTMVSVARAIGPGLATSLFALSLEKNLLGGYAVYAVLFLFSCISLVFAVRLPPQVWDEKD
ncbi:Major facilitator superfamily domain containing protein [Amanita muscaria]